MPPIPRAQTPDSTLAFLRNPYGFIAGECRRHGTDLFRSRLLLRPAIFLTGPEAAELFYDGSKFTRTRAAPEPVKNTLFGSGGVQALDGEAHRRRKAMLLSFMSPEHLARMSDRTREALAEHARAWRGAERVELYGAMQAALTRAVCDWAGVPVGQEELERRRRELTLMFDAAGAVGPRHVRSRLARRGGNRWIAGLIEDVRAGRLDAAEGSVLRTIAEHRDHRGEPLDARTAADSVLNLLRPTVAIAVWAVWAATALHEHPRWRERLGAADADPEDLERFIQEVRRFYPFFPAVIARVREAFEWRGYVFPRGWRAVLDLYGTDQDERTWEHPRTFDPDRFRGWDRSPFNFIPQGGGDALANHRCAGERLTLEVLGVIVLFLVRDVRYDVPEQDLTIDRGRLPALPRSRFVMSRVRPAR